MSDERPVPRSLSPGARIGTLLRSLVVQGSWNYRSMLGSGFGYAMLPGLRDVFGEDRYALERALERHVDHFNAHPYLSGVALGAALRLEADGAGDEAIRRFKVAVRGPLGSLGDGLVWATWLPLVALAALAAYGLGVPGWGSALGFVLVYNVGHLGLRVWGLRVGWESGRDVGAVLAKADLAGQTARLQPWTAGLLGVVLGAWVAGERGLGGLSPVWLVGAALAFGVGVAFGHRAWRPAAVVTVVAVVVLSTWGVLS
ncbi:MAG: PTS system mannose/fructose/sorbose family transporter subunit IID [Gemmatimonadota bacterium]